MGYPTMEQAARHFQVHERTIKNWVGRGYVAGYRFGAHDIRVRLDEIEAMLASGRFQVRDGRKRFGSAARIIDMSDVVLPAQDSKR